MDPRSPKSPEPDRSKPGRNRRRRNTGSRSESLPSEVSDSAASPGGRNNVKSGKRKGGAARKNESTPGSAPGRPQNNPSVKSNSGNRSRKRSVQGGNRKGPVKKRILWIPGLGADRRMYGPLTAALNRSMPGQYQHDLLDFPGQNSLRNIGSLQELAELTLEESIRPLQKPAASSRIYYDTVVGVSMGGMIAQILVGQNLIRAENLVLISTAYRGSDVRQPFLAMAWLPRLLPGFLRSLVQWIIGKGYPLFRKNVAEARQFAQMFLEFPRKIFFDAPVWIKRWSGEPGLQATLAMKPLPADSHSLRVFRIHGTSDPLLSFKKIRKRIHLDQVFEKGSHIVFATEAPSIANSMKAFLRKDRNTASDVSDYMEEFRAPVKQANQEKTLSAKRPHRSRRRAKSESGDSASLQPSTSGENLQPQADTGGKPKRRRRRRQPRDQKALPSESSNGQDTEVASNSTQGENSKSRSRNSRRRRRKPASTTET